jgi:hypothetical protein
MSCYFIILKLNDMAKKTILETLVAKYRRTPRRFSIFQKDIEITDVEREWIEEHQEEVAEAFNDVEKGTWLCSHISVVNNTLTLNMDC